MRSVRSTTRRSSRAAAAALATVIALGVLAFASVGGASAATPACTASRLSARIISWEGAAGSRIANVRLYNTSFSSCYVRNFPRVRLVSATGTTMIGGSSASTTAATLSIAPLRYVRTEVATSNYCGPAYARPVTLTFTLPGTLGRVVAIPLNSTDASGVPPCNGAPGSAGHISMHAWHR